MGGARNSCAICKREMRSMCLQAMTMSSAQRFERKYASNDFLSVRRASSPSCSLRALLTLFVRVGFSSTRVGRPPPLPHRTTKKKTKTWLGLKGDQCEQTFYNGGWSQAQLSYGESSSYSDRGDVLLHHNNPHIGTFYPIRLLALWLRNFSRVAFPDLPSKFLHALFEPEAGGLMLCSSARVYSGLVLTPFSSASLAAWNLGSPPVIVDSGKACSGYGQREPTFQRQRRNRFRPKK